METKDIFKELPDIVIHYSHTIGIAVYNQNGVRLGKLCDYFINYEETYPSVIAIQYKRNGVLFYIPWEELISFSLNKIIVSDDSFSRRSRTFPKTIKKTYSANILQHLGETNAETVEYPPLGQIILDKQIVDTHGKKVVRVNDIQFINTGRDLRVTHAEVGFRSFMRRLGFESVVTPLQKYISLESSINWKYVHAIPNRHVQKSVRLKLTNEDLKELHPADLADILEDLDNHGREMLFSSLDAKLAAETLSEVDDEEMQASLLENENPEKAAEIIENMDTDDAADLLNELDEDKAEAIISNMEDEEMQEEIQELLEHDEDTAGGLMTSDMIEVYKMATVSECLNIVREQAQEVSNVNALYIIDEEQHLLGSITLAQLIQSPMDLSIDSLIDHHNPFFVNVETHWKEVAEYMNKYGLTNVPVVDSEEKLVGMISVDDILDRLLS